MNQSDYRKLAKQLQPDKNPEAGTSSKRSRWCSASSRTRIRNLTLRRVSTSVSNRKEETIERDLRTLSRSSDSLIISARQGNREKRTFVFNADHDDDENESDFAEDESESDSVSSHLHQCRGADGSCRQPEKRFIIEEYIEQFDQRSAWSRHGY